MTFVDLIAQAVNRYVPSAVEKAIKLYKAYQKSEQKQEDSEKYLEALLDVITELMEKIFSYIQSYLRKEYDIEEENLSPEELIKSFYSADGKTIFDRIEEYAKEKDLTSFTYKFYRCCRSETAGLINRCIFNSLKDKFEYITVRLSNECGDCDAGILSGWVKTSEVNLSDLPPFHPDCCCSVEFSNEKPKGRK